jgi:hypothetical protein
MISSLFCTEHISESDRPHPTFEPPLPGCDERPPFVFRKLGEFLAIGNALS